MSKITLFYFLLFSLLFVSCKDERNARAVEALVQEKLQERLTEYERILVKKCQDEILAEASKIVDSILIKEAKLSKDTLNRPAKPAKPGKPNIITVLDSTPIAPILPSQKDTLN